jgi:hypothetical protein
MKSRNFHFSLSEGRGGCARWGAKENAGHPSFSVFSQLYWYVYGLQFVPHVGTLL